MKTITNKVLVFVFIANMVISSTGIVSAQSYNDFGDTSFVDTSNTSSGNGYSFVNYDPGTPVSYGDFSNTTFTNPSTYYGTTNCVGCGQTSTYTAPVVTNTSTYTPVDTSYYGGNSYGTNSYGMVNYSTTNYGYTNYGSTNYGQTGSSWTGVTSCPSGTTLINNTCQTTTTSCTADAKVCPDGSTVGRVAPSCNFAACPVVNQCPSGSYLSNGACITCPNGVAVSPSLAGCQVNNPTCPSGTTLINGTCQINTTVCPTGTTLINNGTCQINQTTCPSGSTLINGVCQVSTTVCPSGTTLVNGTCQINGTQCPAGSTLINGICQINNTACPAGSTLINGVCQVNQTVCPNGSTLINGVCQINQTTCPSNSTLINGVCQAPITCPTGTTYQNGSCLGYGTTVCPLGSTLINGVCQINQTACPSGSVFINGVCQAPVTCPSGTTYQNGSCINNQVMVTCPNGNVVNYLFQCPVTYGQTNYSQTNYSYNNIPQVVYQTCWDGTVLPNTSVCPAQYKICSNGTSIPINQTCYVAPVPVYIPPVVVKYNNVVTSVVTQITNISARCNGIGIIAQGAQSTGWFEYGQTANLGRTTSPAIIGSTATDPFSNVLSNLQPSTAYYCRAVMQNKYGLVKGEIVKFTTKAKVVTYVQPAPVTKSVKKVVKKNEIICSDGSVVSTGNESSATILNQGQKLIAVQMEKTTGDLVIDGNVTYKLSYKNLVGTNLSGVIIKIVIPEELSLTDVPMGSYDEATHTMTFNQLSVGPYSENVITWSGTVKKDASIGKTIVTTAYVLYTVPGTQVQDEVTAYTASSITVSPDLQTLAGSKHVIGAGVGSFLPSSLVEWLALIAILFIIFILGRSIAASYKKGDEAHH